MALWKHAFQEDTQQLYNCIIIGVVLRQGVQQVFQEEGNISTVILHWGVYLSQLADNVQIHQKLGDSIDSTDVEKGVEGIFVRFEASVLGQQANQQLY